ncbi:hypothetical protein AMTRI_Chr11g152830 [Amborella trichopoda]
MGSLPEADRISSLPNCLLESIVSLLPIREAGRTCILSKRWRYVWASAPSLNITDDSGNITFPKISTGLLSLSKPFFSTTMHSSLFSCSSLVSLELSCCLLSPSCGYKGLPSLKILTLMNGSGWLEKLLFECDGLSHLKIHVSSLSFLYVQGKFNATNLSKSSNLKVFVVA